LYFLFCLSSGAFCKTEDILFGITEEMGGRFRQWRCFLFNAGWQNLSLSIEIVVWPSQLRVTGRPEMALISALYFSRIHFVTIPAADS